jgi:ribosomal protein L39E
LEKLNNGFGSQFGTKDGGYFGQNLRRRSWRKFQLFLHLKLTNIKSQLKKNTEYQYNMKNRNFIGLPF